VTIDGELSVQGSVLFNDSLTVVGNTTIENDLWVFGSANIAKFLNVTGDSLFNGDVHITGDLTVDGNFTVHGPSDLANVTADNVDILGDLSVVGGTTLNGDVWMHGDLHVRETLFVGDLPVQGEFDISGSTTLHSDLTVQGSVIIGGDLSVKGDAIFDGRVDITCGPLGFPYNGTNPVPDADDNRVPYTDPTEAYPKFVVEFAPSTDVDGRWYELNLSGFTLNFLEPGKIAPNVYRFETIEWISTSATTRSLVYAYEVGDIIFVKGPSDINKLVMLWDFEDIIDAVGPTDDGNLYLGRSIVSEAMSLNSEVVNSDEILMFMYSPRPGIGANINGQTVVQNKPVEWVKIM